MEAWKGVTAMCMCFDAEEREEKQKWAEEIANMIPEVASEMYDPDTDWCRTRRRMFQVGLELIESASDFYRNAHDEVGIYKNAMQTIFELDGTD